MIIILKQFSLFFAKKSTKKPITAMVNICQFAKNSNRHNFICVQDIDAIFACMVVFLVSAI